MASLDHIGGFERKVRALVEAFAKEFPASEQEVHFGGRKMPLSQVLALLKQMQEVLEVVHRSHRVFRQSVADRRKAMKSMRGTYEDAVFFLKHEIGRENPRLAAFGVDLPKPRRRLSSSALAIARAKSAATRRARGTMGKRQRLALGKASVLTVEVLGTDGQLLVPVAEVAPTAAEALAELAPKASASTESPSGE